VNEQKKIELEIIALSHSITQSQSYAVVLGEKNGSRRLPIVIGGFEAQAIAIAIEEIEPTRPLTHDLMKNILTEFKIELKEVIISDLINGVFYARLVCEHEGQLHHIDSRTSDAIALAARFKCPIFTFESVMDTAGIEIEEGELSDVEPPSIVGSEEKEPPLYTAKSIDELKTMLSEAIEQEDYEKAARIRDEINKRSTN
jgi:hypothetical protein